MASRSRDERGVALPSPVAALSIVAVLLAGVAFVVTGGTPERPSQAAPVAGDPSPTATGSPDPTSASTAPEPVLEPKKQKQKKPKPEPEPAVRRGEVYVEVYNNSGINGLAGATAARASGAGWQVVGSDNWYGTIPQSTVYYPARLEAAAKLLARDLGIYRVRPAISPMRFDRLTVILTADYA